MPTTESRLSRLHPHGALTRLTAVVIAAAVGGCATWPRPTVPQKKIGMVYVLPGIEGLSRNNRNIAEGLKNGGLQGAVWIYDWTTWAGPLGWYVHLANTARNRDQAARLARRIIKHEEVYPERPVFVIGHSGGAGIALMAVEMLPRTHPVDGVILLAAAVSPQRDLTRALSRTRRGIWNFYSPRDFGFLVVGTSLFGTIDRRYGPGAGAVGFKVPDDLSQIAAEIHAQKLHQVRYDRSMAADGNNGRHNGWTHRRFVAKWLTPIVLNAQTVASAPNVGVARPSSN